MLIIQFAQVASPNNAPAHSESPFLSTPDAATVEQVGGKALTYPSLNAMATCYSLVNSTVFSVVTGQQKCGLSTSGIQFCCQNDDTCLEDSICHYAHSLAGGSGYYIGGCTDSSFSEPCSKSCSRYVDSYMLLLISRQEIGVIYRVQQYLYSRRYFLYSRSAVTKHCFYGFSHRSLGLLLSTARRQPRLI